jgi:TP901 family phage tail tape measure protein
MSSGLDGASKKLDDFGAKAQSIGRNLESAGVRIGAMGAAGQAAFGQLGLDMKTLVSGAIQAEQALYGIATTAGMSSDRARAAVGEWTIAINQIAADTNQNQAAVTSAFQDLIAKGLDPKVAVEMLKPIGRAATASGADIQDMASSAQAAFSKLGIESSQLAKSLDIMAQSGKSGAFELRDMAQYFDKLTASASNLGMRGQESLAGLSAAAQIARRGTGDAAQAATNLDNFLSKLNAQVTYKSFEKMGLDLEKMKEEAKASGDFIGYMAQQIQQATGGDTAKIASLFSDVQAGAFIQGMVRDLDDYQKIRAEALEANGVAAQDFATAMQSAGAQVESFKIQAAGAVNSSEALKEILGALKGIASWANENPEMAKWLIFGTAGAALGGAVVAGIGATITAIGSLSTALAGLSAFLMANPIVLAILGVAAAGVAGYKLGQYLGLDEAGAKLGGWIYETEQKLRGLASNVAVYLGQLPGKIKTAVANLYEEFKKIGINLVQGIIDGIKAKAQEVVDRVKKLGRDALDAIKDVLGIKSPSQEMILVGENTALGMLIGLENEAPELISTAEKIANDTLAALEKPFRDTKGRFLPVDAAARAAEEWRRAGDDIERSLTDALLRGFESGSGFAQNFVDSLKNMFNTLVLRPIIQPIAQAAAGVVTGALGLTGTANAASLGSSITGLMAPGSISTGVGMLAGGIAETLGASSAFAGAIGSAVATALPWIGAALFIGSALGIFGGKPSNKAAGGSVSLATGEVSDLWAMSGDKTPSQQTLDARTALLQSISGFSNLLGSMGGTSSIGSVGVDVGERDGIQFIIDGLRKSYGGDADAALGTLFKELIASTTGLEDHVKDLMLAFKGTGSELAQFAESVMVLSEYMQADVLAAAMDQLETASRSLFQNWQAGEASVRSLADAFDGSLSSAQTLAASIQQQYQMEIALIQQIQQLLQQTSTMFGDSIEAIKLSVMSESERYDYYRSQFDEAFANLLAATDPAEIARYAAEVNQYGNSAYGLLSDDQRALVADEFVDVFEQADQITQDRLAAAQDLIVQSHDDLAATIKNVMMEVAAAMKAAAETPLQVSVDVDVNTPANVEVGISYPLGYTG